ncbi:MAG: hypothetical protein E7054_05700 [Lentisphaerae bacterium]|nr:hypothetical protein [Lentisphaerota bacterium]
MNTKSLFFTAAAVLSLFSAAAKPSAEPRRNFRKMVYPNLVKVTRDEVLKIQKSLPEKPGLYGANIHDRKFWADYPMADSFLESAEKRLKMPVPRFSVEEFNALTKKNGKRPSVRPFYTQLNRNLAVMVIAECKENKGRFIPKIEETLDAFITGANPAFGHLFLYDKDMKRQNEYGWRYIELNNALNFCNLATAYFLMDDKISPELRKRVYAYMDEWAITPMFWNLKFPDRAALRKANYRTSCMSWLIGRHNWNPYCNAFTIVVSLAMVESAEQRAYLVASMRKSLENYVDQLTDQGYITEGVGYWSMGILAYLRGVHKVRLATGNQVDLLSGAPEKLRRSMYIGRDMMMAPGGLYPHFADHGREGLPKPLGTSSLNMLNQAFGENIYPAVLQPYNPPGMNLGLEYFYTIERRTRKSNFKPADPQLPYFWDPQAQILVVRDAPEAKTPLSFAIKGGHNGEPHNHNDIGSFVVGVGSRILNGDPGVPIYTAKKAGVIRSSGMHPVPFPNKTMQAKGNKYCGKVLEVNNNAERSMIRLDLAKAYPAKAGLVKLIRTAGYDRKKHVITISDECELKTAGVYELPLISYEKWKELSPGVWSAGSLKVELKASGELECFEDVPDLPWRTDKKARRLNCKFKNKSKTFRTTVIYSLL